MGIHIYARWNNQSDEELRAQSFRWGSIGMIGYLLEEYHGEPYATQFLFSEAFGEWGEAKIPAALLRERLPRAIERVDERWMKICPSCDVMIEGAKQNFRDFVSLCEEKEREQGEPVRIEVWN